MSETDNERHKKRQQKLKEQVDERIRQAQQERGLVVVLTGNGKGKSTSGFGTIARAVGHGQNAAVVQFIKGNWECGERELLSAHGVEFAVMATGFTWETQNKEADKASAQQVWQQAKIMLTNPNIDVVLLDELTYMISYHYLELEEVVAAILQRPQQMSVIITGRGAHRRLIEIADTVSEIQSRKHAFDSGFKARKGIDW